MSVTQKGISFPLILTSGKHTLVEGSSLIEASIKTIISWPYYTRWYLDTFGSRVDEIIENQNDDVLINIVRRFIIDSISLWEDRVELKSAEVTRNKPELLIVELVYRVKDLNTENMLNYEIYTD